METYPANFPCPQAEPYGYDVDMGLLRTAMAGGYTRQRRLFDVQPHHLMLEFNLPLALLDDWQAWVNDFAYDFFLLPLITWLGTPRPQPTTVRFTSNLQMSLLGKRVMNVKVEAEITPAPPASATSAYLFIFDRGAGGYYVLNGATAIAQAIDQSASCDGSQATAAWQPDISAASINGRDAMQVQGDERLDIANALSIFRKQTDVCIRFSILITAAPSATQVLHRIDSGTVNASLINVQLLASRLLRATIRMRGTDAPISLDTSWPLMPNVPAAVSLRINARSAQALWRTDYHPVEVKQALSGGLPGWPGGQSQFEDVAALVAPTLGRAGGTTVWKTTKFEVLTGRVTEAQDQKWWTDIQAEIASPKPTVSVDPQYGYSANKVWLSSGGAPRNIKVGCTITSGANAMIQYRLLKAIDTSVEIVGLTNLGNTAGGKVTTPVAVPRGPACVVELRKVGEPAYNATIGTQRLSVGLVGMWTGASNSKHFWSKRYSPYAGGLPGSGRTLDQRRWSASGHFMVTDLTVYSQNSAGTGEVKAGPLNEDAGGQAMTWVLNDLYDATGYCQEILAYSIGNSPSGEWMEYELPDYPVTGANWQNVLNSIGLPGGPTAGDDVNTIWEIGWFLYMGGEYDANQGVTNAQFYQNLGKLGRQFRTRAGDSTTAPVTPYFIVPLGRINTAIYDAAGDLVSGASPERADAVRQAQLAFTDSEPMAKLAFCCHDQALQDNQHYGDHAYYDYFHYRFTQSFLHWLLPATYTHGATGPRPVSATVVTGTDTIVVACALDGGTKLVDSSENANGVALDGFRVRTSSGEFSGVVGHLLNSTNLYIQAPGLVADAADPPEVFVYSGTLILTNCVRDDTRPGIAGSQCAIGCPLQSSRGWITATVT